MVSRALTAPELDYAFQLPTNLELGVVDGFADPAPLTPSGAAASEPPAAAPPSGLSGDASPAHDGGAGDAAADAATRDDAGGQDRDAGAPNLSTARDAGPVANAPPGTQIAVRVDMTRIRRLPLAADLRALLAAIPDWKALLEGSGIDPVAQLDRLLIASPNLQRENMVLAGRFLGGEQVVRSAVARLAEASGARAEWREEGGVQFAPWANRDATERVIALLGPAHFAIARVEDLPRVLALASARARRSWRTARPAAPADAWLAMEAHEGVSVEIEGASQFVRRRRAIPERLRLAVLELPDQRIALRAVLSYADVPRATAARTYIGEQRDRYAYNLFVRFLGVAGPLKGAQIEQRGREVRVRVELNADQGRLILGYVRGRLRPAQSALPSRAPGP